jgi:hypothetical protein
MTRKMNDTCVKTMHMGMMDRGFTVWDKPQDLILHAYTTPRTFNFKNYFLS